MLLAPSLSYAGMVLEAVVGIVVVLLVLTGVTIIVGPAPWRAVRMAGRRAVKGGRLPLPEGRPRRASPPADAPVHPTTQQALSASARLVDLLGDQGLQRHATALRLAANRLRTEETKGIYAMQEVLHRMRKVHLEERTDQDILEGLMRQVSQAVNDRAEQLELLPRK
ncbi:MAG: hypothetical protein J2P42_05710 [Candidatus Dormibacteraeota bacterium]|nr:hypothetical protein [Candidatus Dormibacteraeota bacterium]